MSNYKFKSENGITVSIQDILTPVSKNNGFGLTGAPGFYKPAYKRNDTALNFVLDDTKKKAGTTTCNNAYGFKNPDVGINMNDVLNASADGALAKYDFWPNKHDGPENKIYKYTDNKDTDIKFTEVTIPEWCNYIKVFLIGGGGGGGIGILSTQLGDRVPYQASGGGAGELVIGGLHVIGGTKFSYRVGPRGEPMPLEWAYHGGIKTSEGFIRGSGGKTIFKYKDVTLVAEGGGFGASATINTNGESRFSGKGGGGLSDVAIEKDTGYTVKDYDSVNDTTSKNGTGYLRRVEKYQGGDGGNNLITTSIPPGLATGPNPLAEAKSLAVEALSGVSSATAALEADPHNIGKINELVRAEAVFDEALKNLKAAKAVTGSDKPQIIEGGKGINKTVNVPTEKQDEDNNYGFFIGRTTEMTSEETEGALIQEMLYNYKDIPISYSSNSKKSLVSGYGCGGNGQTYINGDNAGQPTPGTIGCVCVFYFPGKPLKYPL